MAIRSDDNNCSEDDNKLGITIADWLRKCEKTVEFIFNNPPEELSVIEALQGDPKNKISDPYGYMGDILKKVDKVEKIDKGCEIEEDLWQNISGRMNVVLKNGDELTGRWQDGKRESQGSLGGPRLEKNGVLTVIGEYTDGVLDGQGKLKMLDDSVIHGWFSCGYFHGPARGVSAEGRLEFIGQYRAGIPSGCCWTSVRGGGWLVGQVCPYTGRFTGEDIAFLYPDMRTALVGQFVKGTLVSGRHARVDRIEYQSGVLVPRFKIISEKEYRFWPSTKDDIRCPPLLGDPYESKFVEVKCSKMEGGGEGLFAKVDIPAGTLVAFYNGIRIVRKLRMSKNEKSPYSDTGYGIFVEWRRKEGVTKGDHMDIPPKYQNSSSYCATLAHKLNHSFIPNCDWTNGVHPCFGFVPTVTTLEEVREGEELTIHYSMGMEEAPQWYQECWDRHSRGLM